MVNICIYICEYGEHAKNCFEWFGILFRVWPDVFYVSRYVSMLICDLHSSIVQVVNCVMRSWLCGSSLYVWLPVGLSFYLRFLQDKLQEQFACVRHATLLYNAHLVYTNLPLDDMRPFFFSLFVVADLHPGPRLSVTCFLLTGCSTAIWWLSMERCPARSWTSRLLVQRSMFATARLLQRMGWQVWRYCLGMHWYVEDPISELHTLWKYTKSQGLLMFTVFSASLWNNGPFGRANSGTPKFQKKIRGYPRYIMYIPMKNPRNPNPQET